MKASLINMFKAGVYLLYDKQNPTKRVKYIKRSKNGNYYFFFAKICFNKEFYEVSFYSQDKERIEELENGDFIEVKDITPNTKIWNEKKYVGFNIWDWEVLSKRENNQVQSSNVNLGQFQREKQKVDNTVGEFDLEDFDLSFLEDSK